MIGDAIPSAIDHDEGVTVARKKSVLKIGAGAAFQRSALKRLRQEKDTWEADFKALPQPLSENTTHYLGLVVVQGKGSVLAEEQIVCGRCRIA